MAELKDYLFYQDDWATIYCGNCLEIIGKTAFDPDLLLTDPTYKKEDTNYALRNRGNKFLKGIFTKPKNWGEIAGMNKPFDPKPFLGIPSIILWGANYYADKLPPASKWIIWDKRKDVPSDDNADCEMAWTNLKGVTRIYRQLWKGICREGRENIAIQGDKFHPFQKPVKLMKFCINEAGHTYLVFDPFMGSGSTLVAAKELNRKSIGIEINPDYCEIAVKRLKQEVFDFR